MSRLRIVGALGTLIYWSGINGGGWVISLFKPNPVLAQVPEHSVTLSCQQEQSQTTELQIIRLLQFADRELSQERLEPAQRLFLQTFQFIQSLPDPQLRSNWVTSIVNEESSGEHHIWWKLIQAFEKNGSSESATAVLAEATETIQTLDPGYSFLKTNALVTIAHTYETLGEMEQAENTLELALEASQPIEGAEFKALALTRIAEAYLELEKTISAIVLLNQAEADANAVDSDAQQRDDILAQVGIAFAKAHEVKAALEIAELLDRPAAGTVQLAVVQGYLSKNQPEQADSLAQTIAHPESQALAFVAVANELFHQEAFTQADARFEEAVSIIQPIANAEHILVQVIEAYQQASPDRALVAAQRLQNPEVRSNAFLEIALVYAGIGQTNNANIAIERATQALQEVPPDWIGFNVQTMVQQAIDAHAYDLAIQMAESLTDPFIAFERAQLLLNIAEAAADRHQFEVAQVAVQAIPPENVEMRNRGWQTIAVGYINANQPDAALELLNQIDRAYPIERIRLMVAMARQLALMGNADTAAHLFEQAQQEIQTISTPTETLQSLGTLILEYRNANQPIEPSLIQQMQQTTLDFGDDTTSNFHLRSVAEQLLAANHYETAFQIAQIIPSQYERNALLEQIIQQSIGSVPERFILQTIDAIDSPEAQARQLLSLIDRHLFTQSNRDIDPLLIQSIQFTRMIPDPESRVMIFGNEGGTVVEDEFDRASLLEAIALRYVQLDRPSAAFEVANYIEDLAERDRVTQRVRCHQLED